MRESRVPMMLCRQWSLLAALHDCADDGRQNGADDAAAADRSGYLGDITGGPEHVAEQASAQSAAESTGARRLIPSFRI
jgi:hypothetical protein